MSLVILLRGVNVGGHRTFRPTVLAEKLRHLDAVNIGAAGTLVVHRPIAPARLRAEVVRLLPFEAEVIVCKGKEFSQLTGTNHFREPVARPDTVRFVSVLSRRPRCAPPIPMSLPSSGRWLLKIVAMENRFILGVYRREMKAIGLIGKLDALFGVPVTTRNWNTITAIARALAEGSIGQQHLRRPPR